MQYTGLVIITKVPDGEMHPKVGEDGYERPCNLHDV
jgi:hypothetical protein